MIVELVQQHVLPHRVQQRARPGASVERGQRREVLDVVQPMLEQPVPALDPALGGVGALVLFEVELAGVRRQRLAVGVQPVEEGRRRAGPDDGREALDGRRAAQHLQVHRTRTSPAVAGAVDQEGLGRDVQLGVQVAGAGGRDRRAAGDVVALRRHVDQHLGAIDARHRTSDGRSRCARSS